MARYGATRISEVPTDAALAKADFRNDPDLLFALARVPLIALAVGLGLLIYSWSRELHGPAGALLSLALFCFSPSFLAHAPLVATDVGFTAFLFAAALFFRRECRRGGPGGAAPLGWAVALAFASKFSAILLVFALPALALVHVLDGPAPTRARRAEQGLKLIAGAGLAAALGVWLIYGLRYSASPGSAASLPWDQALPPGETGLFAAIVRLARRLHLAPEAYLFGVCFARVRSVGRAAFLLGRHSREGFRWFFPLAFAVKTPLAALVLMAAGLVRCVRHRERRVELAWLLAVPAIYLAAALGASLNIGHRHILPLYPFLFVLAGGAAAPWGNRRRAARIAAGGVLAAALGALVVFAPPWRPAVVYPDFLAYFNEAAGGPREGWRVLADSDLDWGQGLKSLAAWLQKRGIDEPIALCYFGTAEPRYYGVRYRNMPGGLPFAPQAGFETARAPGWLAISDTNLQGVYYDEPLREEWRRFLERSGAEPAGIAGRSIFVYRLTASF